MGSKSSTSAKTATNYNAQDNKIAADNGGFAVRGDGVTINQTSAEAVALGGAFAQAVSDMTDASMKTARDAVFDAGDLGRRAISEIAESAEGAYDLTGSALTYQRGAQADALDYARRTNLDALDLTGDATGGALDLAESLSRTHSIQQAETLDDAMGIASEAMDGNRAAYDGAMGIASEAMDGNRAAYDGAMDFAGQTFGDALDFARGSLTTVSGALSQTLNASAEDSTQLSQQLIRLGIPAVALVLIAGAFNK
ncbi:MAG: hypothetical protein CSA72_08360 [Rhodobacterales bacterium]|nr:MAG: hypothetical protein CSA72_08360 [Rhodobacterales bacterium]